MTPLPTRPAAAALLASFALLAAAGTAHAQKIKPGLWENTVSMKSSGGEAEAAMAQMRDQLARMSPEQRAQVEAMMARQGMGMAAGKPDTVRSCITPEMASRDQFNPGDKRCTSSGHTRSGKTVRFRFSCQMERGSTSEGEGEFTLLSETETKGKMWVNAQRAGQSFRMDMESSSRWVGADCGQVKPAAAPQ